MRNMKKEKNRLVQHSNSKYSDDIAREICELVATGMNLTNICDGSNPNFPCYKTAYNWRIKNPNFDEMYDVARKARADARADRIDQLREDCLAGRYTPEQVKIAVDIEKWQAGNENQGRYGAKINVEQKSTVTVEMDGLSITRKFLEGFATRVSEGDMPSALLE